MAVNSKKKGNAFENQVCHILRERFNDEFSRVPASGAIATTRKDHLEENAMLVLAGDIITPEDFKFCIECKSRKEFSFWELLGDAKNIEWQDWWEQCYEDAQKCNRLELVIVKYNNRKLLAFLRYSYQDLMLQHGIKFATYDGFIVVLLDKLLELNREFFYF